MVVGIVVKITLFSSPMGVYRRASCHPIVVQTSESSDSYWEIQPTGDGAECFLECPQRGEALPRALSNPFLDVHLLEKQLIIWPVSAWHPLGRVSLKGRATGLKGGVASMVVFTDFPSCFWLITDGRNCLQEKGAGRFAAVSELHVPV